MNPRGPMGRTENGSPLMIVFDVVCLDLLGLGERLDLGEGLLEESLLGGGLGDLRRDVGGDGLVESLLLGLTLLLLVADPRVEDGLDLGLDGGLLLEEEVLVLDLVGLLGDVVELLGEGDDVLERLERVKTGLDRRGVAVLGLVEDVADAADVTLSPRVVRGDDRLGDSREDDKETDEQDSLLVGDLGLAKLFRLWTRKRTAG